MIDNAGLLAKVKWENRSNNIAIKTYIVTTECGKKKTVWFYWLFLTSRVVLCFKFWNKKIYFLYWKKGFVICSLSAPAGLIDTNCQIG
jgi:hypothetical protein